MPLLPNSIGCLAISDPAIEELFTLAVKSGPKNVKVIIAPSDPRKSDLATQAQDQPEWVSKLYTDIGSAFSVYKPLPKTTQ